MIKPEYLPALRLLDRCLIFGYMCSDRTMLYIFSYYGWALVIKRGTGHSQWSELHSNLA